jgi:hypothetical protein
MTGLLAEFGKKLAEKWVTLLVLPGLIYLTCIAMALTLRQRHALDLGLLRDSANQIARQPASTSPGVIGLATAGTLAAAAAAALAAAALGQLIERLWDTPRPRKLTDRRRRRWEAANKRVWQQTTAAVRAQAEGDHVKDAIARRNAISLTRPERPTWIGDRFRSTDQRILNAYDLDLAGIWPRLWLIIPDSVRTELTTARDRHTSAARLTGWAFLYLPLTWWWWPAFPISTAAAAVAWIRARQTAAALADLIEATVDLYSRDLADRLGISSSDGPLTRQTGLEITTALRKDLDG